MVSPGWSRARVESDDDAGGAFAGGMETGAARESLERAPEPLASARVEVKIPSHQRAPMPMNRLAETEAVLTRTDQVWRSEMTRLYGSDGVLRFGYRPEAQGAADTPMRRAYEARRHAIALWRHERRVEA